MKMNAKPIKIDAKMVIRIICGIPVLIVAAMILPWTPLLVIHLWPGNPTPANKYGEFPFHLVYEINGERVTIDDVLICEYAGKRLDEARGRWIDWDERLESGNRLGYGAMHLWLGSATKWKRGCSIKLLDRADIGNGHVGGIYIDIGSAQYYLGYYVLDDYSPGTVFNNGYGIVEEDVLLEKYQIKIIETEFSQPLSGNNIKMKKEE